MRQPSSASRELLAEKGGGAVFPGTRPPEGQQSRCQGRRKDSGEDVCLQWAARPGKGSMERCAGAAVGQLRKRAQLVKAHHGGCGEPGRGGGWAEGCLGLRGPGSASVCAGGFPDQQQGLPVSWGPPGRTQPSYCSHAPLPE